ncbi:uracil phosphoribosyltransferase-domain-containing protein [Ilyonectria robusta]|uniref:uracil phosphoribosyltransferase-domain-containing protein n=1 Tax=Ilyonectria robusta TaxID=1079257 RepID=UPI001E8CB6B0|nr:uracil phosphoribosyltransferase-domain-containing protein [Ilyonectria robusta]KAH8729252.1 uracil phosphoribosyltransferase-domain-containing protein [Ilyonectria robusta]
MISLSTVSTEGPKPTVIGLYGISGSGKSFLLSHLRQELGHVEFAFFEGSDKIASLVPGGLEAFYKLDEQSKSNFRGQAIDAIREESAHSGRVAIVTGHLMFWSEEHAAAQPVYTSNDLQTFTHTIYLNISAEVISQRRLDDKLKDRTLMPVDHLRKWQEAEISTMRHLCRQHHILFSLISEPKTSIPRISTLIRHFRQPMTIESNLARVRARLDGILALSDRDDLETVLVMDGDKTLAAEDTGALFWQTLAQTRPSLGKTCPLQELFSSPLGYSDAAFHQATLLYEEATDDEQFGIICDTVASSVVMHPEIVSLLRLVADQKHIRALVVTCGLGRVWEKVLERHGLSKSVDVIGGGRISDGFVVTAAVKADVVSHLRNAAHLYVWAFGDSPLDLPMLKEADQAIVVVGDKRTRSSSMDAALSKAIQDEAFQARQVLLPNWAPPRLDEDKLPLIRLDDQQFIGSMMHRRRSIKILHATDRNAAKLLTSPTRDAEVAGPALREAHGLEYTIPHVQGHKTTGHRLRNEHQTSIVALMRGGEAMAFGVNAAFPHAMFIHAASATDIKRHHVDRQYTVILVDSVVNSGKTLMEFVEHVHSLNPSIRIVVVAGVVQAEVVVETHALAKLMGHYGASIVALRLSENKFTGTKTTDTGNRLFNTTHLA